MLGFAKKDPKEAADGAVAFAAARFAELAATEQLVAERLRAYLDAADVVRQGAIESGQRPPVLLSDEQANLLGRARAFCGLGPEWQEMRRRTVEKAVRGGPDPHRPRRYRELLKELLTPKTIRNGEPFAPRPGAAPPRT